MIGAFHFLRPWWLLAVAPCAALLWAIYRRADAAQAWRGIVAPHLLPFLLQGRRERTGLAPWPVMGVGWLVAVVALAGPTWHRAPAPFAEDTAALALVVKVTPSMLTEDVQPSRLARSVQKIHDLLALRRGAKAALIAYSGTAHLVMPATKDEGIIETFAQALDPKVMPAEGDAVAAAFQLADAALRDAGGGSILWIGDSVAAEQAAPLSKWRKSSATPVRLLPPLPEGEELAALKRGARPATPAVVALTADDADVAALARAARSVHLASAEQGEHWEDNGYWLTPLLAALLLLFFRRGWMAQTANLA